MSYTPTEWESTDVVAATRMNALEQAVGDMNMSYTPNIWSDGDILSAEKMNALEQAVASGGGGSSDFTIAEVTMTNNTNDSIGMLIPMIFSEDETNALVIVSELETGESVFQIPVYEGMTFVSPLDDVGTPTITGDIEFEDFFIIMGDGTITIS